MKDSELISTRFTYHGPSDHLSWTELACRNGVEYPSEWRADRAVELARAFERVRELCGFPLIINSAYRTAVYNDQIGGAAKSQHVEGRALDLTVTPKLRGVRLRQILSAARQARLEGFLTGIGVYANFIHIDCKPGKMRNWSGSRRAIA